VKRPVKLSNVVTRYILYLTVATCAVCTLFGAPPAAKADPKTIATTQDLYEACKSPDPDILLTCNIYIQGIRDLMDVLGQGANAPSTSPEEHDADIPFIACNAPNAEQVRDVFLSWADTAPNYRQFLAAMSVWIVIQQNWPCPSKGILQLPPG
jgi:hypothetical protein